MTDNEFLGYAELRTKYPFLFDPQDSGRPVLLGIIDFGFNMTTPHYRVADSGHYNWTTKDDVLFATTSSHAGQCGIATDSKELPNQFALVNIQMGDPVINPKGILGKYSIASAVGDMISRNGPRIYSASFDQSENGGLDTLSPQANAADILLFMPGPSSINQIGVGNWCAPAHLHRDVTDGSMDWLQCVPAVNNLLASRSGWHPEWCEFAAVAYATSFAPPLAAAYAAMIQWCEPGISAKDTIEIMRKGCYQTKAIEHVSKYGILHPVRIMDALTGGGTVISPPPEEPPVEEPPVEPQPEEPPVTPEDPPEEVVKVVSRVTTVIEYENAPTETSVIFP